MILCSRQVSGVLRPGGRGPPGKNCCLRREEGRPSEGVGVRNVRTKEFVGLAAMAATLAVAAPASADDTTVYACINKTTGNARLAAPSTGTPLNGSSICTAAEF